MIGIVSLLCLNFIIITVWNVRVQTIAWNRSKLEAGDLIASIRHNVMTSQSGTFYGNDAARAIDGKQNYDINSCNCCSVASSSLSSWWQIDLKTSYLIGGIELYGRSDLASIFSSYTDHLQIAGSKVYAGNQSLSSNPQSGRLVYTIPKNIGPQFHFTKIIAPPIVARFFLVIVQNDLLTLCEFLLETSNCENRHFGDGCIQRCHCSGSKGCHSVTGHCDRGECDPGWRGDACNIACGYRTFGNGCNSTCHCSDGLGCEPVNGRCNTSTCEPGWKGTSCDKVCDHGHFGNGCNSTCHCINGTVCEPVTGFCNLSKCGPGLRGTSCDKSCDHRRFGNDCFYTCHCINGTGCEPASGTCNLSECEFGWQGTSCSENSTDKEPNDSTDQKSTQTNLSLIIGVSVGSSTFVALLVSLIIIINHRRRTKEKKETSSTYMQSNPSSLDPGYETITFDSILNRPT